MISKSFYEGVARVLDIGSTMKTHKEVKNIFSKDDYQALASDWEAIGRDWEAIGRDMKKFWD